MYNKCFGWKKMKTILPLLTLLCLCSCSVFEDSATSIAYDIERGVRRLGSKDGSTYVIVHDAKARADAEARTITLQFDKVGALIVWYIDADGKVLESGSTSYLSRFVDIPETIIVDLQIASPVSIELQRRSGKAVVARVY
jgi:hypothetical protein